LTGTFPQSAVTATYDAQDRLLTYGNASYTYTANGELAGKAVGAQVSAYEYDALGNLGGATLPDGTQIVYVVDAENRRVGKKVNGVLVTGFLYSGIQVVAQLDGNNQILSQFVYATRLNSPDYMVKGGIIYRIFHDQLGSPIFIVDTTSGRVVEEISY